MKQQPSYHEMLKAPQWQHKRLIILQRDNYRCRNCGDGTQLQVHHRQYHKNRRTGLHIAPWNYADQLLITLCDTCHTAGHQLYKVPTHHI